MFWRDGEVLRGRFKMTTTEYTRDLTSSYLDGLWNGKTYVTVSYEEALYMTLGKWGTESIHHRLM